LSVEDLTRGGENEEELTLRLEMETKKSVDDKEEDEMWNDGRMEDR
jgi:ribose 1,5-bisphosphokinase PhnN